MNNSIKEKYYTLDKPSFDQYISNLSSNPNALHFFDNTYFFLLDEECKDAIVYLNIMQWFFSDIFESFDDFAKKQIIQSFLIDEIKSTNQIENINSTRHDIFYVLDSCAKRKDRKLKSIVNAYKLLLNNSQTDIVDNNSIRKIYDYLLKDSIDKADYPDGRYYRKKEVVITDGIENIHCGFIGEDKIEKAMNEVIELLTSDLDVYEKNILAHFLIETIHPYYDGNGRLGRYIFSSELYKKTKSYLAFVIAKIINDNKGKYYKTFKTGRDIHEFGCLNQYFISFSDLLIQGYKNAIDELEDKKMQIELQVEGKGNLTKAQKQVYKLLVEGSILSYFGLSISEIIQYTGLSKRSVIYIINEFKKEGILTEERIGKFNYIKLKGI